MFMAKNLEALQRQLAVLQQKVDAAKAKEAVGVIGRIKTAIEFYGLTADDLFGSSPQVPRPPKSVGTKRMGRPPNQDGAKPKLGRPAKAIEAKTPAAKKPALPPKYQDDAGNSWSGHGKRPNWFKSALENGKAAEELLVKSEDGQK
jgi:DNA-binding protein H-NS